VPCAQQRPGHARAHDARAQHRDLHDFLLEIGVASACQTGSLALLLRWSANSSCKVAVTSPGDLGRIGASRPGELARHGGVSWRVTAG
jgi:hypothetical protein